MNRGTKFAFSTFASLLAIGFASVNARAQTTVSCELASEFAIPGAEVELFAFVQNAANVRSYQARVSIVRLSGTGTVSITCATGTGDPHVRIDRLRPDFIFFSFPSALIATNCVLRAAGSALASGGTTVGPSPAYLATYTLSVSGDATPGSTFQISIDPPTATSLGMVGGGSIPFTIDPPCILTIQAPETLTFDTEFCSACVRAPATVRVPLLVSGLQGSINGVQALFSFDPGVLSLTGATVGDGVGSPWDSAALVYLNATAGNGTIAVVLNGTSSAADARVATLLFDAIGPGDTSVDFRIAAAPFATKLTTASSQSIIPTQIDSPTILSGAHSKGDLNGDGMRDGADIQRFVDILLVPGGASAEELCAGDLNGDGGVTVGLDAPLLVDCLVAEICVCP